MKKRFLNSPGPLGCGDLSEVGAVDVQIGIAHQWMVQNICGIDSDLKGLAEAVGAFQTLRIFGNIGFGYFRDAAYPAYRFLPDHSGPDLHSR